MYKEWCCVTPGSRSLRAQCQHVLGFRRGPTSQRLQRRWQGQGCHFGLAPPTKAIPLTTNLASQERHESLPIPIFNVWSSHESREAAGSEFRPMLSGCRLHHISHCGVCAVFHSATHRPTWLHVKDSHSLSTSLPFISRIFLPYLLNGLLKIQVGKLH